MKAKFPYHFCNAADCQEMIPHVLIFCPVHAVYHTEADLHFPEIESLSPDASQEQLNPSLPVTGDAGSAEPKS